MEKNNGQAAGTFNGQPGMFNNTNIESGVNYYAWASYVYHQLYSRNNITNMSHHQHSYTNNVDFQQQYYYPAQQVPPAGHINGGLVIMDDDKYFDSMPPGFRFCPTDYELIACYLNNKLKNQPLPRNRIHEVELYKAHPQELARSYKLHSRETSRYFFTPRERKYYNGNRPSRSAGDGYWKPTGTDKVISVGETPVGYKKSLDYYEGKHPGGKKTDWKMHEYRTIDQDKKAAASNHDKRDRENNMKLDDWVLCRLYKKEDKKNKNVDEDAAEDPRAGGSLTPFQNHSSQQESNQLEILYHPQENDFGGSTSTNMNVLDSYEQHHVAGQFGTSSNCETGINPQAFYRNSNMDLATINYQATRETGSMVVQYVTDQGTSTSTELVNASSSVGPISATPTTMPRFVEASTSTELANTSLVAPICAMPPPMPRIAEDEHLQVAPEYQSFVNELSHVTEWTNSTELANNVAVSGPSNSSSMPQADVVNKGNAEEHLSDHSNHPDFGLEKPDDYIPDIPNFEDEPFDIGQFLRDDL